MNEGKIKAKPGVHYHYSNDEYHNRLLAPDGTKLINASYIKLADKHSIMKAEFGETTISPIAARIGSALHAEGLEPEKELVLLSEETSRATKAFKKADAEAAEQGKILLTQSEYDQIQGMVHGFLHKRKKIGGLLNDGHCKKLLTADDRICEASLIAQDPASGIWMKARPDIYSAKLQVMGDIKSTVGADPRSFKKQCFALGYDLQCAWYLKVSEACGWTVKMLPGVDTQVFGFMAVEKTKPYAAHFHVLDNATIRRAKARIDALLMDIAAARRDGEYGTNWEPFNVIELPDYLQEGER